MSAAENTPSRTRPLRVAVIAYALNVGGAEQHILKLCHAVSPEDAELTVFLLMRDEPHELMAQLPAFVSSCVSPYRRHDPRVLVWLARQMRRRGIDVAHSFLWYADAVASLTRARLSAVPLLCSERGDRSNAPTYPRWKEAYDRVFTFRRADGFVANSHFGARILAGLGCDASKIHVVHNGVDVAAIDRITPLELHGRLGWPVSARLVGAVSGLADYKGVDTLVRAIGQLGDDSCVRCIIVGDGPSRASLESLALGCGASSRIAFLGQQSPAIAHIKALDVAVLTSHAENCSNAILEYMACRKPVIATNVGGNPELVIHGVTGLLIGRDDHHALAAAIERLTSDGALADEMGGQGRARIEQGFRIEQVARAFITRWRRLVRGGPCDDREGYWEASRSR